MRKSIKYFLIALATFSLIGCKPKSEDKNPDDGGPGGEVVTKYHVTFDLNGGTGAAPTIEDKKEGEVFKIPSTNSTKEGFDFAGWNEGVNLYQSGVDFTMPARDVRFIAKWDEHIEEHVPEPHFSQESYTYDKLAGEDLELPIELDGAGFYYLEIDSETVPYAMASYNESKKCIVVAEDFVLELSIGEHTVTAITDGDEEPATCKLIVTNSVVTNFDEVRSKEFRLGYQNDIRFSITPNGTTIKKLECGEEFGLEVPSQYYSLNENELVIQSDWIAKFYGDTEYRVTLSNNDKYNFTVENNVIFYTDYDITTIHSDVESTIGYNPLYQYSTSVSIEDAPEGMSGKALKYIPNTTDVQYDCHGIFTIKTSKCTYMWYEAPFDFSKNYVVSFDYLTHDTTVGQFRFRQEANAWGDDLLIGPENDDVVHHYSRVIKGSELGNGIILWAFFKGGQGEVWVDNYRIVEIGDLPTFGETPNYLYTNEDYTIEFDSKDILYSSILVDGELMDSTKASFETGSILLTKELMESLEPGNHVVSVTTPIGNFDVTFKAVKDITCEFKDTTATYDTVSKENVKLYGSFGNSLAITSVKQVEKADQAYSGYTGWDFCVNNTTKEYREFVTLHTGLNNTGYVEIDSELLEVLYGTTSLEISFNTGDSKVIALNSNILMFSNYDDTSMLGYFNGGYSTGSPLNSGLWGQSIAEVKAYEEGNNGLSVTSTEGAAASSLFTTRLHNHQWDWYHVDGDANHLYRVSFKYRLTNIAENQAYFYVMSAASSEAALKDVYYGDFDQADYVSGDNYYKIRTNLIADGEFHTFDSGYFTFDSALRMFQIAIPSFTASDNKEVLIDDFKLYSESYSSLISETEFVKGTSEDITFNTNRELVKATINNEQVTLTKVENGYTIPKSILNALDAGNVRIELDFGNTYKVVKYLAITDNRVATLTETSKNVTYKGSSVKLEGEFSTTLNVTSLKRFCDHDWDNTAGRFNRITSDGTMDKSYITIEADGLVISTDLINQVYGTEEFTVTFDNNKSVKFTLTSNQIYYSNFNETYVLIDATSGNMPGCQDCSMQTVETIDGKYVLRYTPSKAVLGHALGADNRILTFSIEGRNTWWWQWPIGTVTEENKFYVEFDYKITGECDKFEFHYWYEGTTQPAVALSNSETHFYMELDATKISSFGIGCSAYASASAGSYMDIYAFGFGVK